MAVDNSGNVYVADTGNNRIQKFTSNGVFLKKWDLPEYFPPISISVDPAGNVYVASTSVESSSASIQKFTSDGAFLKEWKIKESENLYGIDTRTASSCSIKGIATDNFGNVYANVEVEIKGANYDCIQKFTSDGVFLAVWEIG